MLIRKIANGLLLKKILLQPGLNTQLLNCCDITSLVSFIIAFQD